MSAVDILGRNGRVAKRLPGYEVRPQQLDMARAVAHAFQNGVHLLVEAGTGVGKSFAYLIPAIERVMSQGGRLVISTHTIALQEQLISKDIPFLRSIFDDKFSAVLVKGRSNYLGIRRLARASGRQGLLFDTRGQLAELHAIEEWAYRTTDGSLSDLDRQPSPAVWDRVKSESDDCLGRRCEHYKKCFYQRARRRASEAQILIVNHALLFSDIAVRQLGPEASILPDYDTVVLDEAHTVEGVAGDHLGLSVADTQVRYLLNSLHNERTRRGMLRGGPGEDAIGAVGRAGTVAAEYFDGLAAWHAEQPGWNGRIKTPPPIEQRVSAAMVDLRQNLREVRGKIKGGNVKGDEARSELAAAMQRCTDLVQAVDNWHRQKSEGWIYWLEVSRARRRRVSLEGRPIDVGSALKELLFDKVRCAVLTSATLTTGGPEPFAFIRERLHLLPTSNGPKRNGPSATEAKAMDRPAERGRRSREREGRSSQREQHVPRSNGSSSRTGDKSQHGVRTLALGSPFNYREQVTVYVEAGMPAPTAGEAFTAAACEAIQKYLLLSDGRAFVLFTSYDMLSRCAARLSGFLEEQGMPLLQQGSGMPRSKMLENFRNVPRSVLFGTNTFWAGVDVPGEALSNVIIVKLPFAVPNHPMVEARIEHIRANGGNPFMSFQVPEAVLKFKQGIGRLIRRHDDRGIIVILDPRVVSKHYGRRFLDALPDCKVIVERGNRQ